MLSKWSEFIHFSFSEIEIALKFEYSLVRLRRMLLFHQGKRRKSIK